MFQFQDRESQLRQQSNVQWKLYQEYKVASENAEDTEVADRLMKQAMHYKEWFLVAYNQLPNPMRSVRLEEPLKLGRVRPNPLFTVSKVPTQFRRPSIFNWRR